MLLPLLYPLESKLQSQQGCKGLFTLAAEGMSVQFCRHHRSPQAAAFVFKLLHSAISSSSGPLGAICLNSVRHRAMSLQLPYNLNNLHVEIVRNHGPCGKSPRRWCGDCNLPTTLFFPPQVHDHAWPSHGAGAGIVQCHLQHVYGLMIFKN